MSAHRIQELLDSHKEALTDNLYKTLSDGLMKAHKEERPKVVVLTGIMQMLYRDEDGPDKALYDIMLSPIY